MKKINYKQDSVNHVPKSIIYWVSQGIVIQGVKYSIKEFKLEDEKLKLIVENNGEFFEIDVNSSTGSTGTPVDITEKLKDYINIKNLDVDKELVVSQDYTNNNRVRIGVTNQLTDKLLTDDQKKFLDNVDDDHTFYHYFGVYNLSGNPTGEADHLPFVSFVQVGTNNKVSIDLSAKNGKGVTLYDYLIKDNFRGIKCSRVSITHNGKITTATLPTTVNTRYPFLDIPLEDNTLNGTLIQVTFDQEL